MKKTVHAPDKIIQMALERINDHGFRRRNQQYETNLRYYEGDQKKNGVHDVEAMDSKGRTILRDVGTAINANRVLTVNKVSPVVDDYASLLGRWPSVRVPAPLPDSGEGADLDAAERKAQKETRLLHSGFKIAQIERQQMQAGFQLTAMGDSVYVLEPDWDHKRILPSVVDPRFCFPKFMSGWRRFELFDLVVAYRLPKDEAEMQYDIKVKENEKEVLVVTYLSPFQRSVVIGEKDKQLGAHTEWNFDFCPAEWVHNKVTQNNRYGTADIRDILALQDYYNFVVNVTADGLVEMTYPITAVINPMRFGQDQISIGPGEVVALEQGGDIKRVAPTPPPQASNMILSQVTDDMMAASGTSVTRQTGEQPHSSIATGRSLHAAQGPQSTRIELRQIQIGAAVTRLCARMLEMQEHAPLFEEWMKSKGVEIAGRFEGKSFREIVTADDIDGWYETTVTFDQLVGMNDQQKLFVAMQGMAAEIGDDLWAREQMGMEDPQGMRDRVESYKLHKAQVDAKAQQLVGAGAGAPGGAAPGGGVAGPGVAPPGAPGPQGPQGGPKPGPPMMRPLNMTPAAGLASAPPQGVTMPQIQRAVTSVASQLKGTVWAVGDLAMQGHSMKPQLLISDYRDHRLVSMVVKAVAEEADIKAEPESKMPDLKERVA